jgi:Protein of unknown function (DUF1488)
MAELAFLDEFRLFDGNCVRFNGHDGTRNVLCGVTVEALKRCDPLLPRHGLVPAEEFLMAFERLLVEIHATARSKHASGQFEPEGEIEVMVKRHDLLSG